MTKDGHAPTIQNRRAFHNYTIQQKFEAGLVLVGCEVKSIRQGKANLQDGYARFDKEELWLYNCYISPFKEGNRFNPEPTRPRKLLMHQKELQRLFDKLSKQPLNLIPLRIYLKNNRFKVELGLGESKKMYDKRASIKKKQIDKTLRRRVKHSQ